MVKAVKYKTEFAKNYWQYPPRFQKILDKLVARIKNGYLLVFLLALLPLPLFDIIGIYSGGTKMNPVAFFVICFVGKFIKLLFYVNAFMFVVG